MKLCECGCGNAAPIAPNTDRARGYIKNQPRRFIKGHSQRVTVPSGSNSRLWLGRHVLTIHGYIRVSTPDRGNVYEHILIAERALGKALPEKAVVHHFNEIGNDNANRNLVICENQKYHLLLHIRKRAYLACGDASARKCWMCQQWGGDIKIYGRDQHVAVHLHCNADYKGRLRRKREAMVQYQKRKKARA